jgi:Flp pilus assembly protein protease CpaA
MVLLPELLALGASWTAVGFDLRTRRIPNRLSYTSGALGVVLNCLVAWFVHAELASVLTAALASLAGGVLLLLTLGTLSTLGWLGFGDTKLGCALGLCLRWPDALLLLPYIALAGGAWAVIYAASTRRAARVLDNLGARSRLAESPLDSPTTALHAFPYAVAIALGTSWLILARHVSSVSLF